MAIFRKIHINFWDDPYIASLTPEQRYFFLYLLTNGRTKQCGIYEIGINKISGETGYNSDTVKILLNLFENDGKILYDYSTSEIAMKNWDRYNKSDSPKVQQLVDEELTRVKSQKLIQYKYSMDTHSPIEPEEEPAKNKKKNQNQTVKTADAFLVVMPFSKKFEEYWDLWKKYKKEQHRFTYKSVLSEQAALNDLVEMSGGKEDNACDLIHHAMAKGWQGIFPIKNQQSNGTGTGKQTNGKYDTDSIKQKLSQRFAERRQANGE